jgi:acetoin utilization deacetylase AcuC-like enzyme
MKNTIEQALAAASKGCEGNLLIASDEECNAHVPGPTTTAPEDRARYVREQPENDERLKVLIGSPPSGILLTDHCLDNDLWLNNCQSAPISDILRVHEYSHVQFLRRTCESLEGEDSKAGPGNRLRHLDRDTTISRGSFGAAAKAAGVVIAAVDAVMKKTCRSAFCAIRPPGHHLGPWGAVE